MNDDTAHSPTVTNPIISDLARRLAECDKKYEELKAMVEPAKTAAAMMEQEYEAMRLRFQKELQEKSNTLNQVRRAAQELRTEASQLAWEKDNLSSELREEMDRLLASQRKLEQDEKWNTYLDENSWLWTKVIRPYQMEGVRFMAGAHDRELFGVANCDQMGLGKTMQARATIDLLQAEHKVFCDVCNAMPFNPHNAAIYMVPAAVLQTTLHELRKWNTTAPVAVLEGSPAQRSAMVKLAHQHGMMLVCNYEQLRSTPDLLWENFRTDRQGNCVDAVTGGAPRGRQWSIAVLDEAHKFKNDGAQLFKLVESFCEHCDVIFPMTGTPLQNRPEEFWAILHMLTLKGKYAGKFAKKSRFIDEYCYQYGRDTSFRYGAADALMKTVRNMVIRRTKSECTDLPPKMGGITRFRENPDELVHYVQLEGQQAELYNQMRDKFYIWLDEQHTDAISAPVMIAQFTRLRQLALYPKGVRQIGTDDAGELAMSNVACTDSAKFDAVLDLMDELGVADGEKVLIFTSYEAEVIDDLKARIIERFPKWTGVAEGVGGPVQIGRITGKENSSQKLNTQELFTNPMSDMRVVIGTTRAMGVGLNLQGACSNAIFMDLDWNPGAIEQAEDRIHRTGQTENVQIHTIHAEGTIDGYIKSKLMGKLDMISGIVDRAELRQAIQDGLI